MDELILGALITGLIAGTVVGMAPLVFALAKQMGLHVRRAEHDHERDGAGRADSQE